MPTITIREVDTSTAGALSPTTNAVYVPGYATMGPINEPILCETLTDFQKIFGKKPYQYKGNHTSSTIIPSVHAEDFETSYIYASDILRVGLPVLFERVFNVGESDANIDKWTPEATVTLTKTSPGDPDPITTPSSFKLKATYPGASGVGIGFSITMKDQSYGESSTGKYFDLTVSDESKSGRTLFTFDEDLNEAYPAFRLYTELDTDASGLVTFDFTGFDTSVVELAAGDTLAITSPASGKGHLTFSPEPSGDEYAPEDMYSQFNATPSIFDKLEDKGEFVFKFLTSGGYPVIANENTTIATNMLKVATTRGDVTALIDYSQTLKVVTTTDSENAYEVINEWGTQNVGKVNGEPAGNYGAVFAPWCAFTSPTIKKQVILAPSFAYLSAYGTSVQTNANYYAVAGVTRGAVPYGCKPLERISNSLSNELQPRTEGVSINPIVEIKPYGNVIWGNRTLKNNTFDQELTATSFLNIRQLSNDVKRVVWTACKACTFEPNSELTWLDFTSRITPTLDQMIGNNGISNYKIVRVATDKKATIVARITLYCIEAVEDFDITVELTDSQITIV